jgi:hypothetical protein
MARHGRQVIASLSRAWQASGGWRRSAAATAGLANLWTRSARRLGWRKAANLVRTTVVIERPNISLCRDATSKPPFALSSSRIGGDCESNNGQSFHSARKRKRGCGLHPHHPRSEKGCGFLRALLQSDEGGDTSAMSRTRPLAKTSIKFSSPIKSVATRRCRTTSF